MKIISAKGQTCNRFWIYAKFISENINNNEKLIILDPDISIKEYPNLYNYNKLKFPFFSLQLSKIIGYERYIKLLYLIFGNKYSSKFFTFIFFFVPKVNFIIATVPIYSSVSQKEKVIELFSPETKIKEEVLRIFNPIISKSSIICGIHIRRGDYANYKQGKYYFSNKEYHSLMLTMKKLAKSDQITFFISSNEKIDLDFFSECNCFVLPQASATKDLYGLSLCDYIIGPPSTFSAWASFVGNKRIHIIENPNHEFSLSSFKHIETIN